MNAAGQAGDLDAAAFTAWLRGAVPGFTGLDRVTKFPGHQSNPTCRVDKDASAHVLCRKPFGPLLPSAHAVDRELRLISALHPTGFPVPQPIALCTDETVIGSHFYLMALIEGRSFLDGTLPDISKADRRPLYNAMIDSLGMLHSIDHEAVGLGSFGAPGNYVSQQVERWTRQYRAAQTDDLPAMDRLIDWLPRSLPAQTRTSVIHGDFRIDNLIYAADVPHVRAVIDWELSTIGDPIADFAYLAMHWVMRPDGRSELAGIDLPAEACRRSMRRRSAIARRPGATGSPICAGVSPIISSSRRDRTGHQKARRRRQCVEPTGGCDGRTSRAAGARRMGSGASRRRAAIEKVWRAIA